MRMILHPGTGTIIDADECVIIDTDLDTDEVEQRIEELALGGRPAIAGARTTSEAESTIYSLANRWGLLLVLIPMEDTDVTDRDLWEECRPIAEAASFDYAMTFVEDIAWEKGQ